MKILIAIPARLNSSRYPEKVLKKLGDKTMIELVHNAATKCNFVDRVIVATDDIRVKECVEKFGGKAVMTRSDHNSGTERIAELISAFSDYDVFVNLQGDQPFVKTQMIKSLVQPYLNGEFPVMTTVASPLKDMSELDNPNTVKVLLDKNGDAIYFSRSSVPFIKSMPDHFPVYHHLGLYAFTRDFLTEYIKMEATPFEQCESLEQLRVLENGYKIRVNLVDSYVPEINTPEDVELARKLNFI